jgi:acetyl-CoA carboxylase biotin carboxylase subunit
MTTTTTFRRLLVANRGEVAVRIARACDELGIVPVLAVSAADRGAAYTHGRETVCLGGPRSPQSYLNMPAIVQAARQTECTALHPGWGFLSENPVFAALCEAHGVTFIGPPAQAMHLMGKKTPAKTAMRAAGLALIPGSDGILRDVAHAQQVADEVGYPVLLKAESGGGGRGMRIARSASEVAGAYADAQAEATAAFGDGRLYLERLIEGGRHIEIQVIADRYGHVAHLGERDCTVQRNHQKLIEESPSPVLPDSERTRTLAAAVAAARSIGYVGAGTMEFLLDPGRRAPLHGDEHPPAGRALRQRGAVRPRPRDRADPRRRRPPAVLHAVRRDPERPRDRVPDQRRGPLRKLPPRPREDLPLVVPARRGPPRRHPRQSTATRSRRTTTA